jgi:hypothetical protein
MEFVHFVAGDFNGDEETNFYDKIRISNLEIRNNIELPKFK